MSKKLAAAISKNTNVTPEFALNFLRDAAKAHGARMNHAKGKRARAEVHAHYVVWLRKIRQEKRLAYYGYSVFVHVYV